MSIFRDVVIQSVLERVDGRRFHNVGWKRVPTVLSTTLCEKNTTYMRLEKTIRRIVED